MKKIYLTLSLALIAFSTSFAQTVDTSGIASWKLITNSYETWMRGAFDANKDTANDFDFGWGNYDLNTHTISGDSIYIIKTIAGDYKIISIDGINSGTYTFTYSDLDRSNEKTVSQSRTPYDTKNFFQYSLDNETFKDLEAPTASWDLVFGKYLIYYPSFDIYYPVSGVLNNIGTSVSQMELANNTVTANVEDTAIFPFSYDISTIGYDWKNAGMSGVTIYDTLVYFVKDQAGNINELVFNGYGGSATGVMNFTVNGIQDSVILGAGNSNQVYYSLENKSAIAQNTDHDWDIAFYAQSSFSSIPVRINDVNGVELYVYPHADITLWNTVGTSENIKTDILSIYPNPAINELTVVLNGKMNNDGTINIYNQNGSLVLSQKINNATSAIAEEKVNISHLNKGLYIIQIEGNGYTATQKLMKN